MQRSKTLLKGCSAMTKAVDSKNETVSRKKPSQARLFEENTVLLYESLAL